MANIDVINGCAWWPSILVALKRFKCSRNLVSLSISYFKHRNAVLKTKHCEVRKKITKGCPQGSCSGPGFWMILYDSVLKLDYPEHSKVIAFADDLILLVAARNETDLEMMGNQVLDLVLE